MTEISYSQSFSVIQPLINEISILGQSFKAVLFDVDSKDSSVGMSCPPVQFLEQDTLDTVKSCIRDNGKYLIYQNFIRLNKN